MNLEKWDENREEIEMENILVSACLLGIGCRYDGKHKANPEVLKLREKYNLLA